jgi:hypothetical protein
LLLKKTTTRLLTRPQTESVVERELSSLRVPIASPDLSTVLWSGT